MSFSITGMDNVLKNLESYKKEIATKTKKAVMDCGQDLKRLSQEEVPVDTHNLQRSAQAEFVEENVVEVSYNAPYALKQHENLFYRHAQGKAKYLEDPLNANREKYKNHIKTAGSAGL